MRSPITALAWEMLGKSRRSVWLVIGALLASAVLARAVAGNPRVFESFEPVYWLLMVLTLFLVFGIFTCAEFNPGRNWHGFPYRLFTLPVPTWILVGCPMFLGMSAIILVYLAWAKIIFAPLEKNIPLWPAAVLLTGIICYQALVWALAGFRITRMIVLGLAGLIFLDLALLPVFPEQLGYRRLNGIYRFLTLLLAGMAVFAYWGACFAVERQRRGGGRGRGWLAAQLRRLLDALPRRTRAFGSPAAAQFWFEWRRAGMVLPVCAGAVLVLVFGPVSWVARHNSEFTTWIFGWVVALPVILAAVVGKGFARPDFWSGDMALSSFQAVRPLPSGEMVVTKMKAAALSVAAAWLLDLAFLSLWLPGWANLSQLKELWEMLLTLRGVFAAWLILILFLWGAVVLTWRGMVGGLWIGLSGKMSRLAASAGLQFLAVVLVLLTYTSLKNSGWKRLDQYVLVAGWTLAALAVSKLWLAVFSWSNISPGRVGSYGLMWAVGTLGLVAFGLLVCPDIFWLKHLVILAALLPLPIARLGLAPRALAKNRHR